MFKRIKKAYQAFVEPEGFKWTGFVQAQNDPEGTVYKQIYPAIEGDGNAVFFGEGSQEEEKELEHTKRFGIKKLFGLGHE